MANDTFQCTNCGDLLQSWRIATYREAVNSGSSVSGGIRCGRCGTVYSAAEIAGFRPKTDYSLPKFEMPFWLGYLISSGMWVPLLQIILTLAVCQVLIWGGFFSFGLPAKILFSIVSLFVANYAPVGIDWVMRLIGVKKQDS
jgi:hypothetical protein